LQNPATPLGGLRAFSGAQWDSELAPPFITGVFLFLFNPKGQQFRHSGSYAALLLEHAVDLVLVLEVQLGTFSDVFPT
jgi:hypothetical protein